MDATTRQTPASLEASGETRRRHYGTSSGWTYCVTVFVVVRLALVALALAGAAAIPPNPPADVPGWRAPRPEPGWATAATAWERWDALWFLRIAESGYRDDDGSAAFFPLYPMTVRGVSWVIGGHPLAAGLIVSNVACLAALVLLYRLSELEHGRDDARRTILYLSIFPTALFLIAPYSESLFLLLVVACFWFLRKGAFLSAGAVGALAAMTRSIGLVLAVPIVIEALRARGHARRSDRWHALAGAFMAPIGTATYLAFWEVRSGDWLAPLRRQGGWLREFSPPWTTLVEGTQEPFRHLGAYPGGYHLFDWILLIPILAGAIWVTIRGRRSHAAYVWLSLLVPLSFVFGGRPFMSVSRFALTMFPVFFAFAAWGRRRGAADVVTAVSAAGLGIFTLLYVNWYWIF